MILQIATALAIGAYVVLSKDAQLERPDATPRESQHPPHPLVERDGRVSRIEIRSPAARRVLRAALRAMRSRLAMAPYLPTKSATTRISSPTSNGFAKWA
jgi:hypothetical protein